jgi:hypothetical protein
MVKGEGDTWLTNPVTHTDEEPIFSFWNIVKPETQEEYDSYRDQGWYDWNCANWGCKWDAGDVEVIDESPGHWHLRFETPWSTATEALVALSNQHPNVTIHNEWTEEQGYGAEDMFEDGVHHELRQWDIPESHEAHEEVWGEESCPCTSYLDNEDEYPYEDCPRETMTTRLAVEQLEKISLTI